MQRLWVQLITYCCSSAPLYAPPAARQLQGRERAIVEYERASKAEALERINRTLEELKRRQADMEAEIRVRGEGVWVGAGGGKIARGRLWLWSAPCKAGWRSCCVLARAAL